jgi:5-methylcytosine-specific restriction endonuclease McrA
LRSATTRSCGCLHKERVSLSPGRALRNSVLANYKNNARIKQYEWALSEECFDGLIRSTCHYCGITPSTTITSKRHPGSFTYNGIDRKHNGEGYTDKNALPCCADCNKAKGAMSYDKFIAYLQRAGAFQLAQEEKSPAGSALTQRRLAGGQDMDLVGVCLLTFRACHVGFPSLR